ncbi:MAG: aminotransferase class V-fold PLP-dependent enzyme [Tissierellales bacterium]|nr:aminotransferase class V-fold PLP-dependent enzyme [Tissierellales bacterium]
MKMFKSDNTSGIHLKILEAIVNANVEHESAYGSDAITQKAIEKFREILGKDVDVFFVTTGTSANVIALSGALRSYEGVVALDSAHINVDECGALEKFSGNKIIQVHSDDGKIYPDIVKDTLEVLGDEHAVQPRIISISQVTELGTLYEVEEIKELADFAHQNGLYLHLDGARIANAVCALNSSFKEMLTDTGVDLVSFGGTKNGMMIGEAIVVFNDELKGRYHFYRKQAMQLVSKMRFISSQFIAYLDGVWEENAKNANEMGIYFAKELEKFEEIKLRSQVRANMIFAYMPKDLIEVLHDKFGFYITDEKNGLVRLVTSFDTTKEDIDLFIKEIENYYK